MTTKLAICLLAATILAAASGCRADNASAAATAKAPPPSVSVLSVAPEQVAVSGEWIATLDGMVNAQIRPQVSGYLIRRTYREGGFVHKGDVLFEIDRRTFDAALNQATARWPRARRNWRKPSAISRATSRWPSSGRLPRVSWTTTSAHAMPRRPPWRRPRRRWKLPS